MDKRLMELIPRVEGDLRFAWTTRVLAQQLSLSQSRVRHLIQAELGTTFARYLRGRRLRVAQHLLATTELSVKEVMDRAGWNDMSHFVRSFDTAFGVSPKRFRSVHLLISRSAATTFTEPEHALPPPGQLTRAS